MSHASLFIRWSTFTSCVLLEALSLQKHLCPHCHHHHHCPRFHWRRIPLSYHELHLDVCIFEYQTHIIHPLVLDKMASPGCQTILLSVQWRP